MSWGAHTGDKVRALLCEDIYLLPQPRCRRTTRALVLALPRRHSEWLRLRRGGDDQVAGSKRKQDEALPSPKVHNFEVVQEWSGNFIVLGTTGSGKTTLIK